MTHLYIAGLDVGSGPKPQEDDDGQDRSGREPLPFRVRPIRTGHVECIVHHLGRAPGGRPDASFAERLMILVIMDPEAVCSL